MIPQRDPEVWKLIDTPTRDEIYQRFKELEEETPETKRRRYETAGIRSPEEATTPYWKEFKRQQLEERRMRHAPTQEQIDKIKNRTVSTQIQILFGMQLFFSFSKWAHFYSLGLN